MPAQQAAERFTNVGLVVEERPFRAAQGVPNQRGLQPQSSLPTCQRTFSAVCPEKTF